MKEEVIAKYLNDLKKKTGLTYGAVAEKSNTSEDTVKNLFFGKTKNPGIDTVAPVIYAMGGSLDEMYNPEKNKDEMKETSVVALKDSYEYQMQLVKEAYDQQTNNIRTHYEQHHDDLKENFEKRLHDKRELIESYKGHVATLEKECKTHKIAFWVCIAVFVAVLIAELMNPNLGWFRY